MKRRLSASIDDELLTAAEKAVADGRAPSVSALVEEALRAQVEKTRRLAAMDDLIALLDEEGGRPTGDEVDRVMREWHAEPAMNAGHLDRPVSDAA